MGTWFEIEKSGNSFGGRQGWAYICNGGEVKVIEADLDKEQEYEDFEKFGKVKLENKKGLFNVCTLYRDTSGNAEEWGFTGGGSFISSRFGFSEAMELIENAQLVTIKEGDIVAIAKHNGTKAGLFLYKLSSVDIHCMTVATLKPLTNEEMEEVENNAFKWLNRR